MDEDSGQFVPIAEERHSPGSHPDMDSYEPDSQPSSLTKDQRQSPGQFYIYSDDKENIGLGSNFTSSEALRTVIRRDGSPTLSSERKRMIEYVPGDNDELFTPAKTLNFTDADETGTDIDDQQSSDQPFGRYMKPTGADLVDRGPLLNGSGNQRIIEGHDSTMDHRVSVKVHLDHGSSSSVPMSPGSSHLRKLSVESQDISPNLYDSLDEKDDLVNQYTSHRQTQNEADISQRSQTIFSPLHSPNHAASSTLKDSPVNVFQGTRLRTDRELAHSSPQSEPPPSIYIDKSASHFHAMSQSLPERINHDNYEEFKNNLGQKTETTVNVSSAESEWYTPSVSIVNSRPSKQPVNHIALNIQRVKNASKANKSEGQLQTNGAYQRVNRTDTKNNVGKIEPSNRNRQTNFVSGKPTGQPRPVVQGSAGQDTEPASVDQRQGGMNVVQNRYSSFPESRPGRNMGISMAVGGRYGGVGSEFMGKRDNTSNGEEQVVGSPRLGARIDHRINVQQSEFESHSLPASYIQSQQGSYSPGRSPQTHDREAVMTQVAQMRSPQGYSFSPHEDRPMHNTIGQDLQGMEDVRSHLQSMLRLSNDVIKAEAVKFDHSDTASELLMDQPLNRQLKFDSSSLMGSRVQEEVSDLVENFPNLSSKIFSDMSAMSVGRQEASVHSENQYLRDTMEKERYRRKHCEQHIQHLNSKLLETQQQLAVAVSTDKKKDIMIEQLDKQLAKVVEGWKKREREKDDYLKLLMKEKSQIEQSLKRQQSMIGNFEREMADTVAELKREKETSAMAVEDLRRQVDSKTREKIRAEEVLEGEQERMSLVMQEWEQLKDSRELAENRAQQLQNRLHKEQDEWYKREQELLGKIDDVKEANLKVIQMERLKTEETERRVIELEERKHTLDTENKRLELELDEVKREKESTKVEMAILEAKFESSQRKLEADLHAQMEKEISEQVAEVHQKMEEMQEELQEKHRRQVTDIHNRHQKDTERQIQQFHDDARRTEDNYRQKIQDLEERLTEYRNENSTLKHAKQKLESQRMEILTKFQYMMQSQWNEAVSLLVNTPHRKQALNGSFVSSISQVPPSQPSNPPTNLNLSMVSSGQPKTSSPNREDEKEMVRNVGLEREVTTDHRVLDTDRVEEYVNSLPTSNHDSGAQQVSQGFLASSDRVAHNQSFSSENSGSQVPRHPDYDPTGFVYSSQRGQGMTFPELNLDQSHLRHIHSSGLPRNIHGYLLNHSSSIPINPNAHLQTVPNHNQAVYNLVTQPGAAVMLRPPQQQSHVYIQGQGQGMHNYSEGRSVDRGPPSPSKHRSQRRVQRRENSHPMPEYEDSDDDSLPPRHVYTQPGMSPPVKQSRQNQEEEGFNPRLSHRETDNVDALSETLEDTVRLNADYNQISERVAEHESRQNELQHYIKMLLDRPPGAVAEQPEHDIPLGSDILETSREMTGEIDLNDTAQAAQLNRELRRLQQLREQSQRDASIGTVQPEREMAYGRLQDHQQVTPGVLDPDQLTEISRLLDQYRHHAETSQHTDDESVNQLLYLLQHLPPSSAPQPVAAGKLSPRSQKNKTKTGLASSQKKAPSVTMRPTSAGQGKQVLDTSQVKSESGQSSKNQSQKKVERKLAGNKQPQVKSKHTAWK